MITIIVLVISFLVGWYLGGKFLLVRDYYKLNKK
jgi:uncharacterized protein YneF (UPF0154 family)